MDHPDFEPGNLITKSRHHPLQVADLPPLLDHQALELSIRQWSRSSGGGNADKDTDSRRLGNLIIVPRPRLYAPVIKNQGKRLTLEV
jgi:hypothetical protein